MGKKPVHLEKWGRQTAKERYGEPKATDYHGHIEPQKAQAPEDKLGPGYDNDTGYVWQHCIAEKKPSFDHGKKRR
jgi:hypothetical protein